ncbi:hypothetical protein HMPREF9144_1583 [Prevotella pallens ATCC 700821]|uniref:Uncharacterized protein n=1 Tax=Prevotella pallens ATCC 700821 TaxID=997353 RepID=F9DIU3_9BACT|nr:hypothetical protein HMPREF9144_1583 [Prevotella pallens ATCC 700821]
MQTSIKESSLLVYRVLPILCKDSANEYKREFTLSLSSAAYLMQR